MKVINICKPDLFDKEENVKKYMNSLKSNYKIKDFCIYNIEDWANTSLLLYEYDCFNLSNELEKKKRKELLSTAKGYDILYKDKFAKLLLLDIDDDNIYEKLNEFKKDFRNEFVYNGKANYIKFINDNDINYLEKFDKDSLIKIKAQIKSYDKKLKSVPLGFNMIYFNMIHFPVSEGENNFEYNILKQKVLRKENRGMIL